jgi:hypothetical protein
MVRGETAKPSFRSSSFAMRSSPQAERLARDGFSVVLNYAGTRALHAWEGTTPNELARMGQPPVVATPAQVPRRQIVPCR